MRKTLTSLGCAFLLTTSALAAEAPMPVTPLYGSVSAGDSGFVNGIALINSSGEDLEKYDTGSETPVVPLGATYGDGSYYRIYRTSGKYATNKYEVVNPVTWANSVSVTPSGYSGTTPLGVTYDGETGNVLYASSLTPWAIYTMTTKTAPPSAAATKYCDLPEQWIAIAMDTDNRTIYGFTLSGTLKKLDKMTKEITVVGETGLVSVAGTSAAVDPKSGELYFASWPSDKASGLYHINKTTAEATLVKTFTKHEHIQGMFFMPTIVPEVPGKPAMPSGTFEGVSLSGTVKFYMPGSDLKGTALEGNVKWTVTADGKVLATGEAAAGSQVSAPVTLETPGFINFSIYCSNDAGDGPKAHCQSLVGPEQPLAVTNVNLSIEGDKATLTWTAPTKGVNGKDLDADKLVYDVYLLPAREKVGDGLKECSYTGTLTEPAELTVHNYEIVARHYDVVGLPASSSPFVLGAAQPPYYEDFEDFVYVPQWKVLDINNDGHTWNTTFSKHYTYLSGISRTWDTDFHNDMIVSPAIDVKGGFAYDIEMEVVASNAAEDKPHIFSIVYGDAPTAEAMTNVILDKVNVTSQATDDLLNGIPQTFKGRLTLDKDARINLGVLVTSGRGPSDFEIHSFKVLAPKLLESPAPVADLKVLPDFDLKDECTLTFTTPTTSVEDHPLIGLVKVEVVRNGEVVETITEPEMGKEYTVVDSKAAHGENKYQVYAYNDGGASDPAEAVVYTGLQLPDQVTDVKIYETAVDGTIHVEWKAPETDIYGQPLNLKYIDYEVRGVDANIESYVLLTDVKDIKADIKIQEPGIAQKLKYVFVYAKNAAGFSPNPGTSNSIIVGEPLEMPFIEHFTTARCDHAWITNSVVGKNKWNSFPGKAQDISDVTGDIVVWSFSGSIGDRGEMQSGKIAVTGKQARLSFYSMNNGAASKNAIEAWVILEDGTTEMLCREIPAGSKKDWTFYTASLEKYEGQNIKLNFIGEMIAGQGILLDEIKVDNHYTKDLRVDKFDIVRSVTPGMEIPVQVTYTNFGDEPATGYNVVVLIDDKEMVSAQGEAIAPGETATISLKTALHGTDAQVKHKGEVRIDYADDQLTENNSKECVIINKVTANPAPTELAAKQQGNSVVLSWTAPKAPTETPAAITESFEDFDSWETDYMGYWTLYDEDELPTATMDIDGFPLDGAPKSWFIFNGSEKIFAANYRVHSGDKCISNMTSWDFIDGKNNSDWIISPALWGHEQKISFYARQCGPNYREDFEVLYSTGSDAVKEFKQLAKEKTNTYVWTKYEYTLPEGTNYFAIRCVSLNQYMLQIDDITYIPENGSSPNLELKGYDVWRDGEKVGEADAQAENYIDRINDGNAHDYVLTANYNRGVSVPSNTANVQTSDVNEISDSSAVVSAVKGAIIIKGYCDNVTVYTTDGRIAGSGVCNGNLTIDVTPGVYVVQLEGQQPVKIIVK